MTPDWDWRFSDDVIFRANIRSGFRSSVERQQREAVIAEARLWLCTPFVWEAAIKGVGVDCGRFVAASYNGAKVRKHIDIESFKRFPADWFLHKRADEPSPFLDQIKRFANEYTLGTEKGGKREPEPADMVIAKLARDWAHSALVIRWPHVIACISGFCVAELKDIRKASQYGSRPMRFFDLFRGEDV